jgi:citronellol/citronellal dehydrogenase
MTATLEGRTLFITGGSRGIGLAIAVRAARDGANVALLAKTAEPHPKLPGTIHTAGAAIEEAGGRALPIVGDVRDEASVAEAVERTAEHFGAIDVCVNNASAIQLTSIEATQPRRYDLMQSVNSRATFVTTRACIPHLKRGSNPHILSLSPPLDLDPRWLGAHAPYTLSKYGMSLLTLGAAEELREAGVAANGLWPRSVIATAAVQNLLGGDTVMARARTPEIVADAAYAILTQPARECTGNLFIDDEVLATLAEPPVSDLRRYRASDTDEELLPDFFVDPAPLARGLTPSHANRPQGA